MRANERKQRKEREEDISTKKGPKWEMARKSFKEKEKNLEQSDDRIIMDLIREYRSRYPDIHEFYHMLDDRITSVSASNLKDAWLMYVNTVYQPSLRMSSRIFKKMNIVELFILKRKLISHGHPINELLREHLCQALRDYSPVAFDQPACVKYYNSERLQNLTLSEDHLEASKYSWLTYIESRLRGKGERRTAQDLEAAEVIYAFRLNRNMDVDEKQMRETFRAYEFTVWVPGQDGVDITEDIILGEYEPKTCVENGELKYIIRNPITQVVS